MASQKDADYGLHPSQLTFMNTVQSVLILLCFSDGHQPRGGLGPRPVSGRGDRGGRFANDGQRVERNNRRNEDRPPREFGYVIDLRIIL